MKSKPDPKVLGVKCALCGAILHRDETEFYGAFALQAPSEDAVRQWPDHSCFHAAVTKEQGDA